MRKRDHILNAFIEVKLPASSDDVGEGIECEELGDCESAHGKDKTRPEEFELAPQPVGAGPDFLFVRHAVAATQVFAWETPADGREVDPVARHLFVPSECGLDPTE